MPVIARDAVASDHLVYAWPFPIGPEEHADTYRAYFSVPENGPGEQMVDAGAPGV